jgi:hypothetical protein
MTEGRDDRGYFFERDADVRLKKQDKKTTNRVFLFVLLALSIFILLLAIFDRRPKTEIINFRKSTVSCREAYADDSMIELKKFSGMETRFLVFSKDNKANKKLVLAKSLKAEKKFGKSFDQAQKSYGEGDPHFRKLLKAVAITESNLETRAVSDAGAKGVMQIMPVHFHFLNIRNPFDSTQNILGGAKLLRQLLDKYEGNQACALAEYNAGASGVKRNPFSFETMNYLVRVENILKYMNS